MLPAALVFGAALLLRVIFLLQLTGAPTFAMPEGGDSIFYENIASGAQEHPRAYFHSPLYRYFLSAVYGVVGPSPLAARIIQHLAGGLSAVLVFLIAWRLFRRRAVALVAGLLQGCCGPIIFYEGQLLPDALLPCLIALSGLVMVRYFTTLPSQRLREALLLGVVLGVTALARPTVLVWLPLLVLAALIKLWGNWSLLLRKQVLLILGLGLIIAPVTLRNYLVERDLVLITANTGLNLYIGNNDNARGTYNLARGLWFRPGDVLDDFSGIKVFTKEEGHRPRSSELSRWWTRKALAYLAAHPWRGVELLKLKLGWWVHDYEFPQLYNYYGYQEICGILKLLPTAGFFVVPGICGLLVVGWRLRRGAPRLYGAAVVLFMASFMPFFVTGRYRSAWMVMLMPLAAWIIVELAGATRALVAPGNHGTLVSRRGRPGGRLGGLRRGLPILALLVPLGLLCFGPKLEHPTLAAQFASFGEAARTLGDLKRAEGWYRRAVAEEPTRWGLGWRLGEVLLERGSIDEARALLEAERGSVRVSGKTHYMLGRVYRRQGLLAQAEASMIEAIRIEPGHLKPWLEVAELKAGRGQINEAIRAYQSALTMSQPQDSWVSAVRLKLQRLKAQSASPSPLAPASPSVSAPASAPASPSVSAPASHGSP